MKAFIVKDDNFKTVGFQVESDKNQTVFTWGIDHASPFYFTKQVNAEEYIEQIFLLKKYEAKLQVRERFVAEFFETAKQNNIKTGSVNFKENDDQINSIKATMNSIIQRIK